MSPERIYRTLRWERVLGIVLVAVLFQTTALGEIRVLGVKPDLLLAIVIALAIKTQWETACMAGWMVGLIMDMFSGMPFGTYALLYFFVGLGCSYVAERAFIEHPVTQAVLAFVAASAANTLCVLAVGLHPRDYYASLNEGFASSFLVPALVVLLHPLTRMSRRWLGVGVRR
jgi:rod shape-determining protein MreD